MKQNNLVLASVLVMAVLSLTSCEAIGGIFQAGMWMGVIIVVIIIVLVLWLINKARR
ncbi:hypothetical protein [Segetibacter sp. 3557_3]|uniref:hypothetical protein n=1 Tax=Segetibacter sp. 3557_3 TaxID=2547429 RepID=UPI001404AEFB|nr:hypothetical protein [Segetibacter sp. 3557_3]